MRTVGTVGTVGSAVILLSSLTSLSSPSSLSDLVGPGISLELARLRAATLRDVRYQLSLDLTASDSAPGEVTARFRRIGTGDVILDFRGRRVRSITANSQTVPLSTFNRRHIRIPAARLRAGENSVTVSFVSEIAPTGASIIRVRDPGDGNTYLYTLLVPSDANQLFPCFDQPDLKTRLSLTLTWPRAWTALANGSLARADTAADHITGRFTETRPLPTYLIAFAAGPWEKRSSTEQGRTISLYLRRSRAREADSDTLLALQHRALRWMEQYFGSGYPFEKYEFLLAPAFPFGGMEHPGVVMYNEDRFIFRERPTLPRRLGRFGTILHETAHQWFGDLVTMRWFDDLWLKEGFATYMAAKAMAELEPASEAWKTFYQSNKPAAYGVDQTAGTTPLWQQMGNLDQAKSAYGAIVYNKAPSVLKQLNYAVGDSVFQVGVRRFLTRHAYGNATWQELLQAIGAPPGFGTHFMLRPGMPIVETKLVARDGKIVRLAVEQHPAVPTLSGAQAWPERTGILLGLPDGSTRFIPVTLTTAVTELVAAKGLPAPRIVFPNAGDYGYFVSLLDTTTTRTLEEGEIGRVTDGLLRSMLWGALWDNVRAARLDPVRYARLVLRELPQESDEQIVPGLLGRLGRAVEAYLPESRSAGIRSEAETVLWSQVVDPKRAYGIRRACLDAFIGLARTPDALQRLRGLLTADSVAGEPVRDPTRWNVVERLLVLGDPSAEPAYATQAARDTTPDGRRRAFTVGAARRDAAAKADYFRRWFADQSLNEDWASGSLGAFNAIEHEALTLPWLRAALDSLPYIKANRRIFFLGSWLGAFIGGQTSAGALGVVQGYLSDHPRLDVDLRQKVLQNLDELERTVRIRKQQPTD